MAGQCLPSIYATLLERVIVADKAVEAGNPVVERPRCCVVFLGRPVETVAAALAGRPSDRFDEPTANAAASEGCVDKEILQVTDLLGRPGVRVKEVVGDPDERRGRAALSRSQAADRAFRGDHPLPGIVVNLGRQAGLVEIEIAAPQLGPTVPVCRDNRVNDDFDQDGSPGSQAARVPYAAIIIGASRCWFFGSCSIPRPPPTPSSLPMAATERRSSSIRCSSRCDATRR